MKLVFADIKLHERFRLNGNDCVKTSSRTAKLLSKTYESYGVFYIKQTELCYVITD